MMNAKDRYSNGDTRCVLNYEYDRETIRKGYPLFGMESPIFDTLAADRFASDVTTFNLGDYR